MLTDRLPLLCKVTGFVTSGSACGPGGKQFLFKFGLVSSGGMPYLSPVYDAPPPTQTAIIAPVSAAEPLVAEYRRDLDPAERLGVPAHVTVLFPFVEPMDVNEHIIATLTSVLEPIEAFDCHFHRVRWFREDVLWLDPEPAQPFRLLTAAVGAAFPSDSPYKGAHDSVIPHLTVGERRLADLPALRAAEKAVASGLPLAAHIDHVLLIVGTHAPNSWRVLYELPLRAVDATHP